jgi:calcineurin-like phosphoesterase family protein
VIRSRFLRTKPIHPHFEYGNGHERPGKIRRTFGDPVSHPKSHPKFVPPPPTNLENLSLDLDIILPEEAKSAVDTNLLVFHSVGDTGGINGDNVQVAVSDAMDLQISEAQDKKGTVPAFYYNLGDVVYWNGQSYYYNDQFYEPYQYYHAHIFAIAGNHDGDTHVRKGDPPDPEPSLFGFMRNFCDTVSHDDSAYRPTMTQPYVYWTFNTPFATIIGLYSNVEGTLDARGTSEQLQWFQQQVEGAPKDKALIIAVHHPPYSLDIRHGGYPDIEIAIDRVIEATGRMPTMVLSGHVHSYQRFERDIETEKSIPYIVAGAGGYANSRGLLHKIERDKRGHNLTSDFHTTHPDLKLAAYNDQEPGFLRITVDNKKKTVKSEYFLVPFDGMLPKDPFDTVKVTW